MLNLKRVTNSNVQPPFECCREFLYQMYQETSPLWEMGSIASPSAERQHRCCQVDAVSLCQPGARRERRSSEQDHNETHIWGVGA